ncbi:tyrosine-type recombinase/integrase [Microbacterium allomyrinae]|uniref:Tyrosine-type recombinase/integrase family protein n=1 Tax=Microbacterium allomyrinae TaxID=2830666 RepID=A0A9X1LWI0_9MICO|nr:site-specific integrase [Microbacterium allomyrinae]MCC2033048.1 tyrosine-type recombinase/integrase family protein [Microbacterium allomyrinae]
MRGKGEGAVYRVPKDRKQPLKYWTAVVELPNPTGDPKDRRRKVVRSKNKSEVVEKLAKLQDDLRNRGDLPTSSMTCEKWFLYWVEQVAAKEVRPNTIDGYRRTIHNHINPAIGRVKLDKLGPAHIRRVHDAILAKGLASTTALLAHRVMSVSLKDALRENRIGRNPATLVRAPRKSVTELHALDLTEALQVLRHVATMPEGALWATSLLTGARRGEVIGLERDRVGDSLDLSWQLQRIRWRHGCGGTCDRIRDRDCPQRKTDDTPADYEYRSLEGGLYWTRPKSPKSWRIIPLIEPLRSILLSHLEKSPENQWGLVFTRKGRPIGPDLAGKDWRKVLVAAGIEKDVRLHDARHTAVDLLYLAGVPEDLIQEIVGHSTRATTRGYKSPQNQQRLIAAMEQFSALLADEPPREISGRVA